MEDFGGGETVRSFGGSGWWGSWSAGLCFSVAVACTSHDSLFSLRTEVMVDPVVYVLEVDSVVITRVIVSEKGEKGRKRFATSVRWRGDWTVQKRNRTGTRRGWWR